MYLEYDNSITTIQYAVIKPEQNISTSLNIDYWLILGFVGPSLLPVLYSI